MNAVRRYGSTEQSERWLPVLATGEAVCCFALTEPDHGSDRLGDRPVQGQDGLILRAKMDHQCAGRRPRRGGASRTDRPLVG
jgi:hypothetical protein